MKPPKQNPLTGTLVIEPQAPAPKPPLTAGAPHPLDGTMMIEPPVGDRTMPLPDEAPRTQAMPNQPTSLKAPFPVASPHRTPRHATPAPWQQVREDVSPAGDSRWSTLVVEPPRAPAAAPAAAPAPAPAVISEEAAPAMEDLLPPSDPWGAGLRTEAQSREAQADPTPAAQDTSATQRVVERKNEARNSLYERFRPKR
jgi:hypothetical protein